jgi:hypothetical protein
MEWSGMGHLAAACHPCPFQTLKMILYQSSVVIYCKSLIDYERMYFDLL